MKIKCTKKGNKPVISKLYQSKINLCQFLCEAVLSMVGIKKRRWESRESDSLFTFGFSFNFAQCQPSSRFKRIMTDSCQRNNEQAYDVCKFYEWYTHTGYILHVFQSLVCFRVWLISVYFSFFSFFIFCLFLFISFPRKKHPNYLNYSVFMVFFNGSIWECCSRAPLD